MFGMDVSVSKTRMGTFFFELDFDRGRFLCSFVQRLLVKVSLLNTLIGAIRLRLLYFGDQLVGKIEVVQFFLAFLADGIPFLDDFGYNLVNASVSGPLLRNKEGESVIGFRAFGQYRNIQDTL